MKYFIREVKINKLHQDVVNPFAVMKTEKPFCMRMSIRHLSLQHIQIIFCCYNKVCVIHHLQSGWLADFLAEAMSNFCKGTFSKQMK